MTDQRRLSELEFIALTAMLFATIAFSIDAMLPALTVMGEELSPADPERATLVVGIFVLGMGIGTFFAGPLSDAFGRKPVILGGYALYTIGAIMAATAGNLESVLMGRLIQGLAVAGPRIAALAMVRDLYSGERMASISSYSMMIFVLVPAVAPLIGQQIMIAFDWRAIFIAFVLFAVVIATWLATRQPETLLREKRVPISAHAMGNAVVECLSNRVFRFSVTVLTLTFAGLFALISSVQPIYAESFDAAETFPYWFAGSALLAIPGNFLNGRLVLRYGMRLLVKSAVLGHLIMTILMLALLLTGNMTIWMFFIYSTSFMFSMSFVFPNLTALSMEPMGHIAGLAASVNGAISTILAAALAIPIGLAFDGTPRAVLIGTFIGLAVSYALMLKLGPRPADEA
ncbi:multidrug effflux MFS transporter [Cognatishimia sp.]|uniref:multidrug effflux MFS transporter n=1 Tax=Cognatishimia sp. TaxID=2211648 RepID=UPI003517BBB0|nr:multidrug effflux MFS transporter [Cognatishimia sp.]